MDWGSLAVRFLIGGVFVAAFGVVGEVIVPKRVSGVLGGAPSVAMASLLLTVATKGTQPLPPAMRGMLIGGVAFLAYVGVVRLLTPRLNAYLAAPLSWLSWLGVAAAGLWLIPR